MVRIRFKDLILIITFSLLITFISITNSLINKISEYEDDNKNITDNLTISDYEKITDNINETEIKRFNTCYNAPIARENFTNEMEEKLKEIETHFKSSNIKVSFSYEDIQTGMHIGYNETEEYFTASVIKSPIVLYIYKMNLENELNLNEVITYRPEFYMGGTGSLQYEPLYTRYTIRELISKTIIESDNIAYAMLCSRIPKEDIKKFSNEKGATTFWKQNNTIWGQINSKDGVIYMKELYKFLEEHQEIKQEILDRYLIASNKLITLNDKNIPIAHKSGWTSAAIHDMAIVYNKQPYVLSINTLLGNDNFISFFSKATNLINEFHEMYWNNKLTYCYNKIIN